MTNVDAPLVEQFLHVAVSRRRAKQRDRQAVVKVDSVADDQLGITVAFRTREGVIRLKHLTDPK